MECQGGLGLGPGGGPGEPAVCSTHGKMRASKCLEEDGMGGYKCAAGMECQVGGGTSRGGQHPASLDPNGQGLCSIHMKMRSAKSLQDDGMGGYTCAPGQECRSGPGGKGGPKG